MLKLFDSVSIFLVLVIFVFLIIISLLAYFTIKIFSINSLYFSNFYFTIGLITVLNWLFIIRGFAYSLICTKNLIFLSIGLMYFIFNFIITDKLSYTNFKSRKNERTIETLVLTSWIVGLILLILSSIKY
ncbi:hypothetical protein CYK65_15585 [Clostridium perfringens]|nr:hypothetical protein CYK65_15585 [Clostridium perfringens]